MHAAGEVWPGCPTCGFPVSNPYEMRVHQLTHSGWFQQLAGPYTCSHCTRYYYYYRMSYVRHLQDHRESDMYACPVCRQAFTSRNGLRKHYRHEEHTTHRCAACNASFRNSEDLFEHFRLTGDHDNFPRITAPIF